MGGTGEFDVVVLGAGAAGLTAALAAAAAGASVGLFEKGSEVGGTTCLSSGVAWLSANPLAERAGIADSREEGLAYLASLWVSLIAAYPDHHPEHPGGKPARGRSLEPELFPTPDLGEWSGRLVGAVRRTAVSESPMGGGTGVLDPAVLADRDAVGLEGGGRAMVAALLRGCLDRGVQPVLEARGRELVTENGRVTGVRVERAGRVCTVRARTRYLALSGRDIVADDADRAERAGLVQEVHPDDELLTAAVQLATEMAAHSSLAVQVGRRSRDPDGPRREAFLRRRPAPTVHIRGSAPGDPRLCTGGGQMTVSAS